MNKKSRVVSATIGTTLEWYDFFVFAALAPIISVKFFPDSNIPRLVNTFGVFAIGFLARPVGGLFWGYIGDTIGRKAALLYSIVIMSISTALIGCLGTYEQIGIFAPILLVLIRIIQGISASGEHTGSMLLVKESLKNVNNDFYTSFTLASVYIGMMLANLFCFLISLSLGKAFFEQWGWRLPFFISILLGFVGYYIRLAIDEPSLFQEEVIKKNKFVKMPVIALLRENLREVICGIGIFQLAVTIPYAVFVFLPSYINSKISIFSNSLSLALTAILILIFSSMSKKNTRIKIMSTSAVLVLILAIPIFSAIQKENSFSLIMAQIIFSGLCASFVAPVSAFLIDLFPTEMRYTGVAMCMNLAATFFGGTAPFIISIFVYHQGKLECAGYYLALSSIIAMVCFLTLKVRESLNEFAYR